MVELILATVLFYFLHSLLAATVVKQWALQRLGLGRWYRLLYSILSTMLFVWAAWAYHAWRPAPLVTLVAAVQVLAWALIVGGMVLSSTAVMRFGASGFIGFVPEPQLGLVRSGLHRHVRHPIYSGIILVMAGWILLTPTPSTLIVVVISSIYLPVGIHLEERKLITLFGADYLNYRKEVPALIPSLQW